MITFEGRAVLLKEIFELHDSCYRIEEESRHSQSIEWRGQHLKITWQLYYDCHDIVLRPEVHVELGNGIPLSQIKQLTDRIERQLAISEVEKAEWPATLPNEWFFP